MDRVVSPQTALHAMMEQPSVARLGGGTAAWFSRRSPTKETPNEDAAAVIPVGEDAAVLVVADGLGGQAAGDRASRLVVEAIVQQFDPASADSAEDSLRPRILNSIEQANHEIMQLGLGAGATLAVVEVVGGTARGYHVGDSEIVIVGGRGRVKFQTVSHSPVAYGVEAGLIDERDAMDHEDRHVVSNIVGDQTMRIEMGPPIQLAPRDTILVASDGLTDNLTSREINELIRKGPLVTAACRLETVATRRMLDPAEEEPSKPDDLTFVLFRPSS